MDKTASSPPAGGRMDLPLIALNILLVLGTSGALLVADAFFRNSAQSAALKDNVFLTTEWRLLKEMKDRTDRLLQDKDLEISELRNRYEKLKRESSSSDQLVVVEAQIRRAEAEREGILAARFAPAAAPAQTARPAPGVVGLEPASPSAADLEPGSPPVDTLSPILPLRPLDSPVAELLRGQIQSLERELSAGRQGSNLLEKEVYDLRSQLEKALAELDEGSEGKVPEVKATDLNRVLRLLEQNRDLLPAVEPILSLADIKTRSLLRAIVRMPAIRAEYPDLMDSLDRYFDLYGSAEILKGKRQAYDEALAAVQSLLSQ